MSRGSLLGIRWGLVAFNLVAVALHRCCIRTRTVGGPGDPELLAVSQEETHLKMKCVMERMDLQGRPSLLSSETFSSPACSVEIRPLGPICQRFRLALPPVEAGKLAHDHLEEAKLWKEGN